MLRSLDFFLKAMGRHSKFLFRECYNQICFVERSFWQQVENILDEDETEEGKQTR